MANKKFTVSIPIPVPPSRGGTREGAGRKAQYGLPVVTRAYTVRVTDIQHIAAHKQEHGCSSASEALRHLIDKAVA